MPTGRLRDSCGLRRHNIVPSKPLHGYTFYIDVDEKDSENDTIETLEGRIASLGGIISRVLSKSIWYFVSGGGKRSRRPRRSGRFLKQNETRAKKAVVKDVKVPHTALHIAREMGLRIFTVAKVVQWVKEIERREMYFSPVRPKKNGHGNGCPHLPPASMGDGDDQQPQSVQSIQSLTDFKTMPSRNDDEELLPPFVKVQDKDQVYEPQYLEFFAFPTLHFDGKSTRSPFLPTNLSATAESIENQDLVSRSSPFNNHKTLSSTSKYSKSGYCDFCESFFRFRDRHIRTKKHQTNIPDNCFEKLDELISNNGSFDDFLKMTEEKRKKREQKTMEQQKKKLRVFLKTLEGAQQSWDAFNKSPRVELTGLVECSAKKENTAFTTNNGVEEKLVLWDS